MSPKGKGKSEGEEERKREVQNKKERADYRNEDCFIESAHLPQAYSETTCRSLTIDLVNGLVRQV